MECKPQISRRVECVFCPEDMRQRDARKEEAKTADMTHTNNGRDSGHRIRKLLLQENGWPVIDR